MTPDERQLLAGLFDRIRNASAQQRDREAEAFIGDAVRSQPYAPYLLAQTVIVQEQALRAANDRLQELEAKVQTLESGQDGRGGGEDTSFLGGLGRSIFGGGPQSNQPPRQSVPSAGGAGGFGQNQGGYAQPSAGFGAQPGPWSQGGGAPQGGGFLKGALGAAAGVAGGVLLANSISGLFRGNNSLGIASGVPGMGGGSSGGETVVNNYYEGSGPDGDRQDGDSGGSGFQNADDSMPDDGGFDQDDSYNA